jgi:3-hydroxyethyl bacteriochlorophyllide a dehydrogenase
VDDVLVDVEWSGVSAGTERLLWSGRMPNFPGMGYPLVPGYETVGRLTAVPNGSMMSPGTRVFVPGARAFEGVHCLFGGAARRLVTPQSRIVAVPETIGADATLLALAATAHHIAPLGRPMPDLIVGHGALGRLLARLVVTSGSPPPVVWESRASRRSGAVGYSVVDPASDPRRDYSCICDVSGSRAIVDELIGRLSPGGEIILAGFYDGAVSFAFPPAFMREVRLRVAAQWQPADLAAVAELVTQGRLSLAGIITHHLTSIAAEQAYARAFEDPDCLKMVLDWRACA